MSHINTIFASLLANVPYQVFDQAQMENKVRYEKRIRRILMHLEEHFREPVRLRDLAELEGITQTHLSHFFAEQLGITFQEYLTRLRVEAAMYLLKTTDLAVTNIAFECGFSDPKYLNQGFKKLLGVSPHEWRGESHRYKIAGIQSNEHTMQHIYTKSEAIEYLNTNSGC